jgi:hypothetical protein
MTTNDAFDRIREFIDDIELMEETDSVNIDALRGEIFRLEGLANSKLTDRMVLALVSSYLHHVIDPQPSIDLNDLAVLHPEDLVDYEIPKELFTMTEYSKEHIQHLADLLSEVIRKMEDRKIDNVI